MFLTYVFDLFPPCGMGSIGGCCTLSNSPGGMPFLSIDIHRASPSQAQCSASPSATQCPNPGFIFFFTLLSPWRGNGDCSHFIERKKTMMKKTIRMKPGTAPRSNPSRRRMLDQRGSTLHFTASNSSMVV